MHRESRPKKPSKGINSEIEAARPTGRGRSTELTALSMSNGLPGHASGEQNVSKGNFIHIAPLNPAYKAGLAGHAPVKKRKIFHL